MANPSWSVNAFAKHIALHLYQYPVAVRWGGNKNIKSLVLAEPILLHCSSARLPCSSGNRGPEMVFGDTEERLSQFGDKWQILNAIREHYLMKREADHGSQLFWDRTFWD